MARFWLLLGGILSVCRGSEPPPGHMQPLGSHTEPQLVPRLVTVPTSREFHDKYVESSSPVILAGLLNSTRLLETWGDDQYLRQRFGGEEVSVEHKKKENRSETGFLATMAEYLDRYKEEDIYMVSSLTSAMGQEWLLPSFLLCGGFTDNLVFSYVWFSSGGTRSVLHTDAFDNLHCLVSGMKEFVLIHPRYINTIGPEHKTQGFYNIDVDSVDMLSHPGLVSVPWHQAVVWPGDCLFLPHLWVHHVRSHDRNLGVNLWWSAFQYEQESCSEVGELPDFAPLSDFDLVPELQLKQGLLDHTDDSGLIHASHIHQTLSLRPGMEQLQLESVLQIFDDLKPGCQGQLLSSEIKLLPVERFVSAFRSFVSSQSREEEWADEGGEWGEGGWEGGGEEDWGYSQLSEEWEEEEEEMGGGDFPHDHQPHDEL